MGFDTVDDESKQDGDPPPPPRRRRSSLLAPLYRRLASGTPRSRAADAKKLHRSIVATVAAGLVARARTSFASRPRLTQGRATPKKVAFDDLQPSRLEILIDQENAARAARC